MMRSQAESIAPERARGGRGRAGARPVRVTPAHLRKYGELKRHHSQLKRGFVATCVGLGALCLVLGAWAVTQTHGQRRASAETYGERARVASLEKALAEAQGEVAQLVRGRIPNLLAVTLDRVVPIGDRHVRNVTFTSLLEGGATRYEYKLVLQNDSEIMTLPAVDLVLFDRVGVEIARSRIGEGADAAGKPLYPGESRSYSGSFALPGAVEPAYFRTQLD